MHLKLYSKIHILHAHRDIAYIFKCICCTIISRSKPHHTIIYCKLHIISNIPKKVVKRNIRAVAITPYDHKEVIFSIVNIVSELKRAFVHSSSFYKKSTLNTCVFLCIFRVWLLNYTENLNKIQWFVCSRAPLITYACKSESCICLQTIFFQSTCRMETKRTK